MDLVDVKTGKTASVPDADAEAAVKSGKYTFAKGQKVAVRNDVGRVGTLDADKAMAALASGGATLATSDQLHRAQVERKYGGFTGGLEATGEGLARGLTLGLSDPLAIALGGEAARQHLADVREAHPYLSGTAEVAGALAPVAFSGGAAAPEEAAVLGGEAAEAGLASRALSTVGALPRGVARLGEGAGALARGLVGDGGESMLARAAQKAIPMAAQGGVEGAIYGAGSAIDENSLNGGNHDLTAEQLMAAAGHGALFGGALGGGLGLAGEFGSTALKKLAGHFADAEGDENGFLAGFAKRKAFKALQPSAADEKSIAKFVGGGDATVGAEKIGENMLTELPKFSGGKRLGAMSVEEIADAGTKAKDAWGQKIDDLLTTADEKGTVKPNSGELLNSLQKEIYEPLSQKVGYSGIAGGVKQYLDDLAAKSGSTLENVDGQMRFVGPDISFKDLHQIRRDLDGLVYRAKTAAGTPGVNVSAGVEELRALRGRMEQYLVDKGDEAASQLGDSWREKYLNAKAKYQSMREVERIGNNAVERMAKNRSISLSDYISGSAAIASGHGLAAPIIALGNKFARERGNQMLADIASRFANIGAVENASRAVDAEMTSGVRRLVNGTRSTAQRTPLAVKTAIGRSSRTLRDSYEQKANEVRQLAANPQAASERLAGNIGTLSGHAPGVATALAAKAMSGLSYLQSSLPPQAAAMSALQGNLKGPPPSDTQMASWLRKAAIVDEPTRIFDELRHGRATQDEVDALKAVYPSMYADLQTKVMGQIADAKKSIPYERRKMLGILLGIPADITLQPDMVAAFQSVYATAKPASGRESSPGRERQGHIRQATTHSPERVATTTDRIEGDLRD